MSSRNKKNNDSTYADEFKPAIVYGTPSTNEMLNQVFLAQQMEDYDSSNNQMLYASLGYDGTTDNPDAKPIYTLETPDPNVTPNMRAVLVKGKEDYAAHSYLLETDFNNRGVFIIMLKQVPIQNQVYCNIRFLPYSTLQDILVKTSSDMLEVSIPSSNVIKLNITLQASTTGETLYKTHKTEADLENATPDEITQIKKTLEFQAAQYVAYVTNLILAPIANDDAVQDNSLSATTSLGIEITASTVKKGVLWVSLVSTAVATGIAGYLLVNPDDSTFALHAMVLVVGGIGGLGRNTAGLISAHFPAQAANANNPVTVNTHLLANQPRDIESQVGISPVSQIN